MKFFLSELPWCSITQFAEHSRHIERGIESARPSDVFLREFGVLKEQLLGAFQSGFHHQFAEAGSLFLE